jgi:hypothetical protein
MYYDSLRIEENILLFDVWMQRKYKHYSCNLIHVTGSYHILITELFLFTIYYLTNILYNAVVC